MLYVFPATDMLHNLLPFSYFPYSLSIIVKKTWSIHYKLNYKQKNTVSRMFHSRVDIQMVFLPDPRGAGLHQGFHFCTFVRPLVCPYQLCAKDSYTAIIPLIPNIFTDSEPPIK